MIENRGTRKPDDAWPRCHRLLTRSVWNSLWISGTALALLAGCGVNSAPEPAEISSGALETIRLMSGVQEPQPLAVRVAGLIHFSEPRDKPSVPLFNHQGEHQGEPKIDSGDAYWAFPGEEIPGHVPHQSGLERLPPEIEIPPVETPAESPREPAGPIAVLLPPQPIESVMIVPTQPAKPEIAQSPHTPSTIDVALKSVTPTIDGLSEQERLLVEQVIRDCSEAATGVMTDARVDEMAATKIRQANALANRGAQYAARQKLIEALRMISQAKDAQQGDRQFTSALATGLRALDEAEDFAPRGTQLEGELELDLIIAAHRTPIARQSEPSKMLPRQMMDRYFRYAQLKLAISVANEPAGSMALYALGKVTSQMGMLEPQRHRLAHRRALAFQQAALLSHDQNHLAAHELAVLLAESGHFAEAQNLLLQLATRRPHATVYENLARVQQRMGLTEQAAIGHALAARLAQHGAGGANRIQWVAPEEFIRTGGGPTGLTPSQLTPSQLTPSPGGVPLPMTRRPRYDRRTAMVPRSSSSQAPSSSPAATRSARPTPPPNWR